MPTSSNKTQSNVFIEIWHSFRATPGWVQFWMLLLLMPINMASLFFLNEPMGMLIAFLANIGMLLPHIIPWTALVVLIIFYRPDATGKYDIFLWVLLVTNLISLAFDYVDSLKWIKGSRAIASR